VHRFNTEIDVKFSTYAVPMIWGHMARYRRDHNTMINYSRGFKDLYFKIYKLRNEYMDDNEICKKLNITMKQLNDCSIDLNCDSIDREISSDINPIKLGDILSNNEDIAENVIENEYLKYKLKKIKEYVSEEQFKAFCYYLNGKVQSEIAKIIGVSQPQISRNIKYVTSICKIIGEERKIKQMKERITKDQLYNELKVRGVNDQAFKEISELYNVAVSSLKTLMYKYRINKRLKDEIGCQEITEKPSDKKSIKQTECTNRKAGPIIVSKLTEDEIKSIEHKQTLIKCFSNKKVLPLLTPCVYAGKEFKYEISKELHEISILKNDEKLICNDLKRMISELQELYKYVEEIK
jgi:RNA polymerase sigma factor (sigma-70 family)